MLAILRGLPPFASVPPGPIINILNEQLQAIGALIVLWLLGTSEERCIHNARRQLLGEVSRIRLPFYIEDRTPEEQRDAETGVTRLGAWYSGELVVRAIIAGSRFALTAQTLLDALMASTSLQAVAEARKLNRALQRTYGH
jgi:hypothetical protein